jgi:hypothetical protein
MAVPAEAVIDISTTSSEMPNWQSLPAAVPPTITMNGAPFAQLPEPSAPNGFQLVVINSASDLTNPANIVDNEFFLLTNDNGMWADTYGWMYEQMLRAVLEAGNIEQQLILIASFGIDAGMPPPTEVLQYLLEHGAGGQLQGWEKGVDIGSQGSMYIDTAASYILVGGSGYGYGEGTESYAMSPTGDAPASVSVTLGNNVPPGSD